MIITGSIAVKMLKNNWKEISYCYPRICTQCNFGEYSLWPLQRAASLDFWPQSAARYTQPFSGLISITRSAKKTIMVEGETMTPDDDVSYAGANDFPLMRRSPIFQPCVLLHASRLSQTLLPFVPLFTAEAMYLSVCDWASDRAHFVGESQAAVPWN